MEKKFNHAKIEVCNLCKKDIKTDEERWCALIDYVEKEKQNVSFYHQSCLKDLIRGTGKALEERWKKQLTQKSAGILRGVFANLKGVEN